MDQNTQDGPEQHLGGASWGAQPGRERLGAQARPGGLCPPRGTTLWYLSGPSWVFWSIKILQKVLRCLDSV